MKAIRVEQFGPPAVLKLDDVPPPQPSRGQILVRIHAAGVNPVETYIRAGTYPRKPTLPYTPGTDGAGVIEAVGEGAGPWLAGDRVYTSGSITGTYAELALCESSQIHRLPASISFPAGAAIGIPYATAWRALFHRGQATPRETLLIHGASGGVGTAAVQIARAHGLRVFGTAGTERGRQLVTVLGAHQVFDHTEPRYLDEIAEATGGKGVDLILEMLANVNLGNDLKLLAPAGRVVVVGSRGKVEIDPRDLMSRDADVRGMILFATKPEELAEIHSALLIGLENGTFSPIIAKELPLAEAAAAHKAVLEPGSFGKIVLVP